MAKNCEQPGRLAGRGTRVASSVIIGTYRRDTADDIIEPKRTACQRHALLNTDGITEDGPCGEQCTHGERDARVIIFGRHEISRTH